MKCSRAYCQVSLHRIEDVVVAAPTASGKTVLAELAMVRELSKPQSGKILYLAPLRALTNERKATGKDCLSQWDLGSTSFLANAS